MMHIIVHSLLRTDVIVHDIYVVFESNLSARPHPETLLHTYNIYNDDFIVTTWVICCLYIT